MKDRASRNIDDFTCQTWLTSGVWTFKLTRELKKKFRDETREPKRRFRKATHDEVYISALDEAKSAIVSLSNLRF